ncbi:MAG: Holliday junction resolvase RuvX [Clostridia bacterium]|nr:Holliday junction resolvase RuvX [Clostridia bacterium]
MRKMALDVGDARIGIAFSDPMGIIAGSGETYKVTKDRKKDFLYLADYAKRKECDTIVIGLPLNMDGTEGDRVVKTRSFADELARFTDLTIVFQDERWSTVSAEKMLIESGVRREKRKDVVDLVAAKIILQSYLDRINK